MRRLTVFVRHHARAAALALALAAPFLAAATPSASAHDVYIANYESASVSVIDSLTNQPVGEPIPVGEKPAGLALTPDGRFLYVADYGAQSVSVVDTSSHFVSTPIAVLPGPVGVAITPDGQFAYVTDSSTKYVSVIETQTSRVVGPPIEVGSDPEGIAISPDGRFAYVVSETDGSVSVIETQTRQVVGEPIKVGTTPERIAITPDGKFAYVTNFNSKSVSVIDLATRFVGPPIPVPEKPSAIAIGPDGRTAYVTAEGPKAVSTIDLQGNQVFGAEIPVGGRPDAITLTPDGRTGYVSNFESKDVSAFATDGSRPTATVHPGGIPAGIAVAPNQAPHASFVVPDGRPGVDVAFDASGSGDSDGSIARYEWSFGDGKTLSSGGPAPRHAYKKPGDYKVTLTLTDDEGCSTAFVFTGQTAYCDGGPAATQTQAIRVSYPGVRLRCPKGAGRRGCRFTLVAVTKRHGGKAESAVAKAKAKAGERVVVALKARKAFAARLAKAKKVLVQERARVGGRTRTHFVQLKIVH